MSFAVDTNILLYASNEASPHQRKARAFLDEAVTGPEILFLTWPVIFGYLRISTHAAVFPRPLTPETAMANIERLLSSPHVRLLQEDDFFWETYKRVAEDIVSRGKAVADAHLATLLLHHGIRVLYTNDSDFRKFRFLEVRNPFE